MTPEDRISQFIACLISLSPEGNASVLASAASSSASQMSLDGVGMSLDSSDQTLADITATATAATAADPYSLTETKSKTESHLLDLLRENDDIHLKEIESLCQLFTLKKSQEFHSKTIDSLTAKMATLKTAIDELSLVKDEASCRKCVSLRYELIAAQNEAITYLEKSNELTNKMQFILNALQFNAKLFTLWKQEPDIKRMIDEKGLFPTLEAFIAQKKIEKPVMSHDTTDLIRALIEEFSRQGNIEIVEMLNKLYDPYEQETVFLWCKEKFEKTKDPVYGFLLSRCYGNGFGTEYDKSKSVALELSLENTGHPLILSSLATKYFNGDNVPKDKKKSEEFLMRATAVGQSLFIIPHWRLGAKLLEDDSQERQAEGIRLIDIAARSGSSYSACTLVSYYSKKLKNENLTENEVSDYKAKAFLYAKMAADLKSPIGITFLARCYATERGVTQDLQRYQSLLSQADMQNCVYAAGLLAIDYSEGVEGMVQVNPIRALFYFLKSLRRGFLESFNLFQTFYNKHEQDNNFRSQAYEYCYSILYGHLLNNDNDSVVLGYLYQHGLIMPKCLEKAIICFQKAADLGNADAAKAIALLCTQGGQTLLAPSLARKYFGQCISSPEVDSAREKYYATFLPLFGKLKSTWLEMDMDIPLAITTIINDYAYAEPVPEKPKSDQKPQSESVSESEPKLETSTSSGPGPGS